MVRDTATDAVGRSGAELLKEHCHGGPNLSARIELKPVLPAKRLLRIRDPGKLSLRLFDTFQTNDPFANGVADEVGAVARV